MKKNTMKTLGLLGLGVALTALAVDPAMAQTGLNKVTGELKGQMGGVADLLSAVSYIGGVGFGIKAALKLKEHNESKGQTPLSQPITMGIVAALLIALPTFLKTATETLFGGSSQKTTADGGQMRSIQ